jgi:hypothetical protein
VVAGHLQQVVARLYQLRLKVMVTPMSTARATMLPTPVGPQPNTEKDPDNSENEIQPPHLGGLPKHSGHWIIGQRTWSLLKQ